jgi:membrane-associated protease RseP (regulator of RpoE activity)
MEDKYMHNKNILLGGVLAALGLGLIALPGTSKTFQEAVPAAPQEVAPPAAPAPPQAVTRMRIMRTPQAGAMVAPGMEGEQEIELAFGGDSGSWLGVETQEVTAEKVKDLKLSAERGVLIGKVLEESPAAKSGLKDGDVVTEINGQRIEGTAQFRRMIREIPAGRSVQLTVWRDGRSQTINATLGKMQENHKQFMTATPQVFNFRVPEMPEVAQLPEIPTMEWDGSGLLMGRPRLGIDAEDISGQLGAYFGAPEGEGILVRDVNPGSAAEKAGVKAGDVITSLNGDRIHSLAELRSKLSAAGEGKSAKLGILRNKTAVSLDVEIPALKKKTVHKMEMRTKI